MSGQHFHQIAIAYSKYNMLVLAMSADSNESGSLKETPYQAADNDSRPKHYSKTNEYAIDTESSLTIFISLLARTRRYQHKDQQGKMIGGVFSISSGVERPHLKCG